MNVVFIVLDTVRRDVISLYNDDIDFTDNLEEFSSGAKIFQNAVSQSPWTLPTHASMFTGQYPWEHGATQRKLFLETDRELLAQKFEEEGYETACYTANTWISPYTGLAEGFHDIDNFYGVYPNDLFSSVLPKIWAMLNQGRGKWLKNKLIAIGEIVLWGTDEGKESKTPQIVSKSKEFVESADGDFFLFMNFLDCHLPYYPPEEYREKHAPDVDPDEICQRAYRHNAGLEEADFEASRKLYEAGMDYLDDKLGELFDFFEERGLMEETVFVIVSDHGDNLGEDGGMFGHEFSVSEELVSVPMIIRAPGLESGEVEQQVELRELYEMVPVLAGIEEGEFDPGTEYAYGGQEKPDMWIKNIPKDQRDEFYSRFTFVRGDGKKLVREESGELVEENMTDLETGEEIDVEDSFHEMLESVGEAEEGETEIEEEKVKKRLEDLGYMS